MANKTSFLPLAFGTVLAAVSIHAAKKQAPMQVVPLVDLTRYTG